MIRVEFDMTSLNEQLDRLQATVTEALKPAAQAGAQVLYNEVRLRALTVGGSRELQASIYQKYLPESSVEGRAAYAISWRKQVAPVNIKTGPNPEAGMPYSTKGYLIEYGHTQRYATYIGSDGEWHTAVQPSQRGKKLPKGKSKNRAAKDAHFVLRAGGPVRVPARSFLRSSFEAKKHEALEAVYKEMQKRFNAGGRK
jgi:hypothetical protein